MFLDREGDEAGVRWSGSGSNGTCQILFALLANLPTPFPSSDITTKISGIYQMRPCATQVLHGEVKIIFAHFPFVFKPPPLPSPGYSMCLFGVAILALVVGKKTRL